MRLGPQAKLHFYAIEIRRSPILLPSSSWNEASACPRMQPFPRKRSYTTSQASGATYLIAVQLLTRALTFVVNQILLRFLSPELLGIANQLDLYAVSVLYFARESLRVALQRGGQGKELVDRAVDEQACINLSYTAVVLSSPLAAVFAALFLQASDSATLAIPYRRASLAAYALACLVELLAEPAFAVAQRQQRFALRARAETIATLARCLLTCASAIWAMKTGLQAGALPFACGQVAFAVTLNVVYYSSLWSHEPTFSFMPTKLVPG